jgi:hypothetical protein
MNRLALLALAAALAAAGVAAPARAKTSIKDHVMLRQLTGQDTVCSFGDFRRVLPDGTIETEMFVVPAGRALVVTDFVWSTIEDPPFSPPIAGLTIRAKLSSYSAPATGESLVYESEPVNVIQENVLGTPGAHSRLTTGAVVGAGRFLCTFAAATQVGGAESTVAVGKALVYGILVKSR